MNDELELALAGLHRRDITPPPLKVVVRGAHRRRSRRRVATTAAAVIIFVGAVGAFGAALDQHQAATITSNETTTSTAVTTSTLPETAPAGYETVVDGEGHVAGYLARSVTQQVVDGGDAVLDIGTGRYEIQGLPVVDLDGATVGYLLFGPSGFVSLAEVADPQDADALGAAQAADPQTQEQGRELLEQLSED